jgi:hypothetical protein
MTIKTLSKNRKALPAGNGRRIEMRRHDWDSGSADDRPLCPVQYGWQRAAHAHTILGILRVVRNTYFPQYRLSDVVENIYVALPVFIAHVAGSRPPQARLRVPWKCPATPPCASSSG